MKKVLLTVLILLLSVSLFSCTSGLKKEGPPKENPKQNPKQTHDSDEAAVVGVVEDFGSRLQKVSLLAPQDIVSKSMQENYGDLVSPELLTEWLKNPSNAPGRVVSSPWPDRIEIQSTVKSSDSEYEVKGKIIEMTSVEVANGGAAARRPITLAVGKVENRWLITAVTLGEYEGTNAADYRNTQYSFSFSLPKSWQGYTIITDKWEGIAPGSSQGSVTSKTGPLISIRHPQWTAKNQRQDIPIMIFTLAQWDSLQREDFHIGAAPMGPKELGRNAKYVFALPARYNYAFPIGYEEVENILQSNSFKTL